MSTNIEQAMSFFIATFFELAVLFVLVSFIVSLVNYYLPAEKIKKMLSGSRGYGTAISLGAITPFCSCSTLPMMVGLLKARAEFGPVMAFLFTSPLVNPFIFTLFWVTFGSQITLLYTLFALMMSAICGFLLQRLNFDKYIRKDIFTVPTGCQESSCSDKSNQVSPQILASSCCIEETKLAQNTIVLLFKDAMNQFWSMIPYMVLGVAIGAILHGFVPAELITSLSGYGLLVMIPLSAFIGVFLYVRASTMVPIAASLVAKGMSVGAVMSLTIAGAGASLPEMVMLKKLFHWPLLIAFIGSVFFTACVTGFTIEFIGATL